MDKSTKAGRPAKWSGPTTAIRVPLHLAEHLKAIARQLDSPEPANNVQNPSGLPTQMLTSEGRSGTYRLFLDPPRKLPPQTEEVIEAYCDRVFGSLTETERVFLLGRLVEELGVKIDG